MQRTGQNRNIVCHIVKLFPAQIYMALICSVPKYFYGRARMYGHLWKTARIMPVFL